MKTLAASLLLAAGLAPACRQESFTPDSEGFIRNWLVLAPLIVEEGSASTEIDKDFLKGEAKVHPKAGDKVTVDGKEFTWKAHQTADFYIDFLASFGKDRGEDAAAYAVSYLSSEEAQKVKLAVGSNDECKVWLNGKEVLKHDEPRTLEKDSDTAEVSLKQGENVLVFKVINEKNNWQGCARFLKEGVPVKNLKISLAPR